MRQFYTKWIIIPLLAALLIVLLCVGGAVVWVATGPRSLQSVTSYMESALSPGNGYRVRIENSEIKWDTWKTPIGISARNIELINDKGAIIAYFPEAKVELYFYELFIGVVEIKSLELMHPKVVLLQNDDGSFFISSGDKNAQPANSASSIVALILAGDTPLGNLHSLIIRDAEVSVKNKVSGTFLQSADASLEIIRKHGRITGNLSVPLTFGDKKGSLFAEMSRNRRSATMDVQLFCKQIPTAVVYNLFPAQTWLEGVNIPMSLALRGTTDRDGHINNADFVVEAGQGSIRYPAEFSNMINLQHAKIVGNAIDNLNTITISLAKLTLIGANSKTFDINFRGAVSKTGNDYGVDAQAETANVPVNDVPSYWPFSLSPHSRKWVTTHISDGTLTKAEVTLHFKPGELKLKDTPEKAIEATLALKGATVKYLPGHPPATDVSGVVKFTGKSMDAKIASARYMTGTQITSASVTLPDMYPDDVRMFIDMNVTAPAKDIAAFLALPRVEKAQKLNIASDITGQVSGNAKLDFIAFSEHDDDKSDSGDINYAITATLSNIAQKKFLGNRDIENANMNLKVDNKGLQLNGSASVNAVPMDIDLTSSFGKGHETAYSIKCNMPANAIARFGLPAMDYASGTIGVSARFVDSDTESTSDARLDLTPTDIKMTDYGFIKKAGMPATLDLSTARLASGNTQIKSFLLKGTDTELSGNGEFDKASDSITALTFDRLHFGRNNLKYLDYKKTAGGITLSAEGESFDISPFISNNKNTNPSMGYNINIKTNRLIFGDDREMDNATVLADCGTLCRSASIEAELNGKSHFSYAIKDGKLNATTDDAGTLARILGIIDTVEGGKMMLSGVYNGDRIEGALDIKNYALHRAPILTKILTIASLTGFLDTLSGNGIAFDKLHTPFTYKSGIIVIKDGKTHGSALGLTANGTIDTTNSTLDLSGVVIPSYTMNSMIGNVPLIGNLLMGGKDKGILAINYTLKGSTINPSVSVNPLSAFTPGFLRGVFDVFDQPAPDIDKIVEDRKKAEAAQQEEQKKKGAAKSDSSAQPVNTPRQSQ